jgi:hypothetical protein
MKFFYYCFYRITNVYFAKFEKWGSDFQTCYISSMGLVTLCQSANILSIITIPFIFDNKMYSKEMALFLVIPLYVINWFFILTKRKYMKLKERWQNENPKYKKLKGYFVVLYIVSSLILYFVMINIMANASN